MIRGAHQAPFYARGLQKTGAVSENAPGAHRNVPRFGGCSTRRRIFHGDAPSRGQHRPSNPSLRGPSDLGNPNSLGNPNNLSLSNNPSNPGNLNAPSNRNGPNATNAPSNLSRRNNPSSPNSLSNQ